MTTNLSRRLVDAGKRILRTVLPNELVYWASLRTRYRNWISLYWWSAVLIPLLRGLHLTGLITHSKIRVVFADGVTIFCPGNDMRRFDDLFSVLVSDSYLRDHEREYSQRLSFEEGDVVLDIGAHVGRFALPLLTRFPSIRIIAFEPDPVNFACLAKSRARVDCEPERFQLEQSAVWKTQGQTGFAVGAATTQGSVADAKFFLAPPQGRAIRVNTTTLDEIFAKYKISRCKLVKLDCEGSEYDILESTSAETISRIENMFVEVHPAVGRDIDTVGKTLRGHGFEVRAQSTPIGCQELFCVRPSPE